MKIGVVTYVIHELFHSSLLCTVLVFRSLVVACAADLIAGSFNIHPGCIVCFPKDFSECTIKFVKSFFNPVI